MRREIGRRYLAVGLISLALLSSLSAFGSPPQERNSALLAAVKRGDKEGAKRLLGQGANPNTREILLPKPLSTDAPDARKPYLGNTALMLATKRGDIGMARLLLQKGANVNDGGEYDHTPLMEAVTSYHTALVRLFLARGANPNALNASGDTALVFAANGSQRETIQLLLDNGADVNKGSQSPLFMAVQTADAATVKLLLKRGANVNSRHFGFTPLEYALLPYKYSVMSDNVEKAALLRKAGGKARRLTVCKKSGMWRSASGTRCSRKRASETALKRNSGTKSGR